MPEVRGRLIAKNMLRYRVSGKAQNLRVKKYRRFCAYIMRRKILPITCCFIPAYKAVMKQRGYKKIIAGKPCGRGASLLAAY
jgi:hypothetical protein